MKKALEMIINFVAILIAGLIVGSFVYIQYLICINMIAGHQLEISKKIIFYALLESSTVVFLLMIPCLIIYKIRHLTNPVATAITFSILCALVWLVFLPCSQIIKQKAFPDFKIEFSDKSALSNGYFRNINDRYYYFMNDEDTDSETADTLLLYDAANPGKLGQLETVSTKPISELAKTAEPYKDPLIKQNMSDIPLPVLHLVNIYAKSVSRSWTNGFISWLCFCSIGFLMASVYSLVQISPWRIVNFTYIVTIQLGAVLLNTVYYTNKFFNARLFLNKLVFGADFSRFQYFQTRLIQLPLVIINLLLGIIIIVTGIIITAVKHNKYRR